MFVTTFSANSLRADFQTACEESSDKINSSIMKEMGFESHWNQWNRLNEFYKSNPLKEADARLSQTRKTIEAYQQQNEEIQKLAALILKAIDQYPEMNYFLNAYQADIDRGEQIINTQEIDKLNPNWFEERQEIKQLLYLELETKYKAPFEKALDQFEGFKTGDIAFMKKTFFVYYGKDFDLPWNESFEFLFRHSFDSFYSAGIFEKIGKFNAHTYAVKANVTTWNPTMELLIAYEVHEEERINIQWNLYPFTDQKPEIQFCDFSLSENPLHCEVLSTDEWCALRN